MLGKRKQSSSNNYNTGLSPSSSSSEDPKEALSNSALERLQLHMQLQGLQNPLSFYTHHQLWPKLHPIQEKFIQTLQSLNHQNPNFLNPNLQDTQLLLPGQAVPKAAAADFFQPQSNTNSVSLPQDYEIPSSDQASGEHHEVPNFAQVDDFLNEKAEGNFMAQPEQMAEFDCFKEVGGSKDGLVWWSQNEHDLRPASSSNSWDSSSVLQSELMFQDYDLGYNL